MSKNEVIIWQPFPSPNGKNGNPVSEPGSKPVRLTTLKPKTQSEIDAAAVERWTELADIVLGQPGSRRPKKNKKQ